MSGAVLLTGATGFLGMEALAQLVERGEQVVVMVRARDEGHAWERLQALMTQLYDRSPAAASSVELVRGDLLEPGLGISEPDRRGLLGSIDRILHCAASISFDLPLDQARAVNVGGVEKVIDLARELAATGRLRRLVHVSTAYVSGRHEGSFGERDLDVGQRFRNSYERSKHESEQLLRAASDLPVVIVRPSIVVGHSASGWTPVFNVLYWPMRAVERGLLQEIPARHDSIVDFVPVDYVIEASLRLLEDPDAAGTYNLVAGQLAMSAGELVTLHASLLQRPPLAFVEQREGLPTGAETLAPYFDVRCSFGDARALALLEQAGMVKPDPRDYLAQLLAYAQGTLWGKRALNRQAAASRVGLEVDG